MRFNGDIKLILYRGLVCEVTAYSITGEMGCGWTRIYIAPSDLYTYELRSVEYNMFLISGFVCTYTLYRYCTQIAILHAHCTPQWYYNRIYWAFIL